MTLEWYYMEKIHVHVYTAGSRDRVIWFTGRQNYVDLCKRRISNRGVFPYDKGILCILTCCRLLIMCEWLILIDWLFGQVFDLFIGQCMWWGYIHTCICIWIWNYSDIAIVGIDTLLKRMESVRIYDIHISYGRYTLLHYFTEGFVWKLFNCF